MRAIPLLMICMFFSVLSCGGGGGGGGGDDQPSTDIPQNETPGGNNGSGGATLVYDSELTSAEKAALDNATAAMAQASLNGSSIGGFSQVFGGNRSSSVVGYFERRVNYALSSTTNLNDRVSTMVQSMSDGLNASETVAVNVGMALWLAPIVEGEEPATVLINGRSVRVTSSRVGIIQFGNIFARTNVLVQLNTLLHEARHSDCTGGVSAEEMAALRNNEIPASMTCGHFHVRCPSGPYAGELACDARPWGAYAVGAIHSLAIARTCDNCTETAKTVAETLAADSFSRLLYSKDDLLDGKLGQPDMNSSTSVQE